MKPIKITIKLFGYLRNDRFVEKDFDFPEGLKVVDVLQELAFTHEEFKVGAVLINGSKAGLENVLQEGDLLAMFPPATGG